MKVQKKIKSMQMFRKPIDQAKQGDRLGICVTNFDAKLIERGIAGINLYKKNNTQSNSFLMNFNEKIKKNNK